MNTLTVPDATTKPLALERLVRLSPSRLEIRGRVCGLQKPWENEPCGGRLLVKDWHPRGVRGWTRYEIYCEKCQTCDPNGWARQDEILAGARTHFQQGHD